ncbi:ParA family protein [Heliophilum fasciatum]|uniref:Chromosome partitioning protein n=1 Tax=Heliophilum fasciatum TaxID=35700 RepID=A0A4R2RAI8_9FIRM|nr:AAA family ATPase [Heliophilum fasciatum]MCW2279321.1 chromosome partitioning protein [Heliophilum fasciatum]TCP60302.1 chromosome partitioning protein [Heliophilum fasciatum]
MIISVINYKGGVGKTTLTANIASEMASRGQKVLIIDLDPQTNLTLSFLTFEQWDHQYKEQTIQHWYDAYIDHDRELSLREFIIQPERINKRLREIKSNGVLALIPSHLGLVNVDNELAIKIWKGHQGISDRSHRHVYLRTLSRLKTALDPLTKKDYDTIFIDCPPNLNYVTQTAIIASDGLLIPAKPDYLSTLGISELQRHLHQRIEEYNTKASIEATPYTPVSPAWLGVAFTMVGLRNNEPYHTLQTYIDRVKSQNIDTFKTYITENKSDHSQAPETGIPVVLTPENKAQNKSILYQFRELSREVEEKIQRLPSRR